MTFRTCSSPAPTPVKPQPAPAILSQESVHTTLSITHHTRKRPSTSPRTTHGPHEPQLRIMIETFKRHDGDGLGANKRSKTKKRQRASAPNQSSKNHKRLPLHTCKLPLNQCTSPWTNACKPLENKAAVTTLAHTGQTGHHHQLDRCPTCAQDQHSDRSHR
jgi:hypothetical protein